MNTLFVDRRGITLKADAQSLTVHESGARIQTVPLAPLKRIFIHSDVMLDSGLLGVLGERGIGMVVMSGSADVPRILFPAEMRDVRRRIAQHNLASSPDKTLAASRWLMRQKCAAQAGMLREWAGIRAHQAKPLRQAAERIQSIAWGPMKACDNLASLRGLEGAAAAIYFEALRTLVPEALGFNNRNRRPPRDPFNALLSLAYALLQAEAALALRAAGLDPYLGFYHVPEHGRPAMACDLMELLRPEADGLCLHLVLTGALTEHHFGTMSRRCALLKEGRSVFFPAWEARMGQVREKMWEQMRELGRWLQGEPFDFSSVTLSDLADEVEDNA